MISYVYTVYGHVVEIDRHNDQSMFFHLHHHKDKYVFTFVDN